MKSASPKIVVVGAGLAGLSVAFRLRQQLPLAELTVLEKKPNAGGNIGSRLIDGFRIEQGPNGFLDAKPSTMNLCRDLGIHSELIAASEGSRKNRYLAINGKLVALPSSFGSFLTSRLLSWRGKFNILWEKYRRSAIPEGDESIYDFAVRRAGKEVAEILADAFVTGIHAGDPKFLSVNAAFPRLKKFEREFGSVSRGFRNASRLRAEAAKAEEKLVEPMRMWSFREGLGRLIDALVASLGNAVRLSTPVQQIRQVLNGTWQVVLDDDQILDADAVILTAPAHVQTHQVRSFDSELADELASIDHNTIAVAIVGYRKEDAGNQSIDGFGFITPQNTKRDILGVQWCSSIFPGRAPDGFVMWRALCGGTNRPDIINWDDDRLLKAVHAELKIVMGVTAPPKFTHVVRWPHALPQYHLGHLDRVARIEKLTSRWPGLYLGGNAFRGVAMNDQTEDAERIAQQVADYIGKSFQMSAI